MKKRAKFKHIKTREGFIARAKEKHGDSYLYHEVKFKKRQPKPNSRRKTLPEYYAQERVAIVCPTHGTFYQRARKHLEGSGCIACASARTAERLRGKTTSTYKRLYEERRLSLPDDVKQQIIQSIENRKKVQETTPSKKFKIKSPTNGDYEILIDEEDWEEVSKCSCRISIHKNKKTRDGLKTQVYIMARYRKEPTAKREKSVLLHRFIMKPGKGMIVDHINGNTLDNRKSNLRVCTYQENAVNSIGKRNSITGLKGVKLEKKSGQYSASIRIGNQRLNLGQYSNPEDAAKVYDIASLTHFGDYAVTNHPIETYLYGGDIIVDSVVVPRQKQKF